MFFSLCRPESWKNTVSSKFILQISKETELFFEISFLISHTLAFPVSFNFFFLYLAIQTLFLLSALVAFVRRDMIFFEFGTLDVLFPNENKLKSMDDARCEIF